MKEEKRKEIEMIVNQFFLETKKLVNKLIEKIYEIEELDETTA